MAGNLSEVIKCAKFQDEIFRGYDFTGGQISHFLIDFRMGLTTVQRDCAACDVIFHLPVISVKFRDDSFIGCQDICENAPQVSIGLCWRCSPKSGFWGIKGGC